MKKIVIIGGGVAGLSAGVFAVKAGFEVEIYEKNMIVGGQCMGWNRSGHHIDNCIHWLTGTKKNTELRRLWEETGALTDDTEFVKNDRFYTSYIGKQSVTLWKDLERTREELLAVSPEDTDEINKFICHVKYASCCQMPVSKPMDCMNPVDYIRLGKLMADLPKVLKKYGKISIDEFADTFKNPLIKTLFKDYMPGEYQASSLIISYATIVSGNGDIPVGGSLAMAQRMKEKFEMYGGTIYHGCEVRKINIVNGRAAGVELVDGRKVSAEYVIGATDTMELFAKLLDNKYWNDIWKSVYEKNENYPLFSGFQVAFSAKTDVLKGIENLFFDCTPFDVNGKKISRISLKSYDYEKGFAPKGKFVLQSNVIQYEEDFFIWKDYAADEYNAKKLEIAEIIKERITKRFPECKNELELLDSWTPVTYERYCNSYHGAYMSFITKPKEKSFSVKGTIETLPNVFIASQWLQSPGGLPVAAASGKFAVQRIMKKEKVSLKKLDKI